MDSLEKPSPTLEVAIRHEQSSLNIVADKDVFVFSWPHHDKPIPASDDFAAWLVLPVAMAKGQNLLIHGQGHHATKANAERLSDIWSTWLPRQFSSINVDFSDYADNASFARPPSDNAAKTRDLMFFSGGVDSTYGLIERGRQGLTQDLVTLWGMDYSLNNEHAFYQALRKNEPFISTYCDHRFIVRSNASDIYHQYGIKSTWRFVFLLAAVGFMYNRKYRNCVIASDFSCHQQYLQHMFSPYGSNFATNPLFCNGVFALQTTGQHVTRAEKMRGLLQDPRSLRSISLCKNKAVRPENCGVCPKCLRTKAMFLAANGEIPPQVFLNNGYSITHLREWRRTPVYDVFLADMQKTASRAGHLDKLPWLEREYRLYCNPDFKDGLQVKSEQFLFSMKKTKDRMLKSLRALCKR